MSFDKITEIERLNFMNQKLPLDLEHFLNRTSLYVTPVNRDTIVSFIHGYEIGLKNNNLTDGLKKLLANKYDIMYSSDGWPGQIYRLSERLNLTWIDTLKKLTFELIEKSN